MQNKKDKNINKYIKIKQININIKSFRHLDLFNQENRSDNKCKL